MVINPTMMNVENSLVKYITTVTTAMMMNKIFNMVLNFSIRINLYFFPCVCLAVMGVLMPHVRTQYPISIFVRKYTNFFPFPFTCAHISSYFPHGLSNWSHAFMKLFVKPAEKKVRSDYCFNFTSIS